jgi:WD40 repeat protein
MMVAYRTIHGPLEEWDLKTGQTLNSWPTTIPWKGDPPIALCANGKNVVLVSHNGTEGSVIQAATGQASGWNNPEPGGIQDVNFCPDGSLFAVASWGGYAEIWDTVSPRVETTFGHRQYPMRSVIFSPDGSRLVTTCDSPDLVTLWDLGGRELLKLHNLENVGIQAYSLRFSADGNLLGCRRYAGELYLWRAPSWTEIEAAERASPYPP